MAYMDSYYVLSLNILKALGGDTSVIYPDADAIWVEINKIYDNAGNRFDIVPLEKNITENGQYDYYPDGDADAFMPVNINVNVPQKYTDEQVFEIEYNAIQQGYDHGYAEGEADGKLTGREEGYTDGYNTGIIDGEATQKAKLVDITITESGVYTEDDGYKTVTVDIEAGIPEEELQQMLQEAMDEGYQDGYAEGVDDGFVDGVEDQKAKLETTTFRNNGTYTKEDGWNVVTVDVDMSGGGGKPKIYNGFQFTGGDIAKVDFSQYDWSGVYDTSYFFQSCSHSTGDWSNFLENYNGKILSGYYMFRNCSSLKSIPQFDTSNVIDMYGMFESCSSLTSIPQMDTSNVTNMGYMFESCSSLTSIPQMDTSNVTNMHSMFTGCTKLKSIPQFDTSNVIDMYGMFESCSSLTSIPQMDTSNVTTIERMFYGCSSLTSIPQFDTSNVTSMNNMFTGCTALTSIPKLNCGNIQRSKWDIAGITTMSNLTDLGGFEDLGKVSGLSKPSYFLTYCPNLTKESVMNVINNLYDRASAGYSVVTLPFNIKSLALLSDEEKAIATNKGWTLATS